MASAGRDLLHGQQRVDGGLAEAHVVARLHAAEAAVGRARQHGVECVDRGALLPEAQIGRKREVVAQLGSRRVVVGEPERVGGGQRLSASMRKAVFFESVLNHLRRFAERAQQEVDVNRLLLAQPLAFDASSIAVNTVIPSATAPAAARPR